MTTFRKNKNGCTLLSILLIVFVVMAASGCSPRDSKKASVDIDSQNIRPQIALSDAFCIAKYNSEQLGVGPVQYPEQDKQNISAHLVLSDALCNAQYKRMNENIEIGECICKNTEAVTTTVFQSVLVDRISDDSTHAQREMTDAILIPRFKMIDRDEPRWAGSIQTTTIVVEWTLKDAKDGTILWVTTVTGQGKDEKAPGLSRKEGARRQVMAALDDLFGKTYSAMSSSVEIKGFSSRKTIGK